MESFDYLIVSRSLERLVAALLGGGTIYWGYRIFLSLPNISALEDNFRFKKYLFFNMIKIGAGTVFLIFGAYIVLATILKPVTYEEGNGDATLGSYSGVGDHNKKDLRESDFLDYNNLPGYFSTLNRTPSLLDPNIDARDAREVQLTISRIKLNLMLAIWKPGEWGDKVTFRNWVIQGANGPKPETVNQKALDLFLIIH